MAKLNKTKLITTVLIIAAVIGFIGGKMGWF